MLHYAWRIEDDCLGEDAIPACLYADKT
jgi:hypothetical protein